MWELFSSSPGTLANWESLAIRKTSNWQPCISRYLSEEQPAKYISATCNPISSASAYLSALYLNIQSYQQILIGLRALNPNRELTEKICLDWEKAIFQSCVETLPSNTWLNLTSQSDNHEPIGRNLEKSATKIKLQNCKRSKRRIIS